MSLRGILLILWEAKVYDHRISIIMRAEFVSGIPLTMWKIKADDLPYLYLGTSYIICELSIYHDQWIDLTSMRDPMARLYVSKMEWLPNEYPPSCEGKCFWIYLYLCTYKFSSFMYRNINAKYGNTSCGVFKRGVQN